MLTPSSLRGFRSSLGETGMHCTFATYIGARGVSSRLAHVFTWDSDAGQGGA